MILIFYVDFYFYFLKKKAQQGFSRATKSHLVGCNANSKSDGSTETNQYTGSGIYHAGGASTFHFGFNGGDEKHKLLTESFDAAVDATLAFDDDVDIKNPPIENLVRPKTSHRITKLICIGKCENAGEGAAKVTEANKDVTVPEIVAGDLHCKLKLNVAALPEADQFYALQADNSLLGYKILNSLSRHIRV